MRPRRAEVYRNIKQYPSATQTPYICVVRVDAPIYFANVDWVRDRIRKYAARSNGDEKLGPVRYVVLDMAPISYVDSTGACLCTTVTRLLRSRWTHNPAVPCQHSFAGCGSERLSWRRSTGSSQLHIWHALACSCFGC